MAARACPWAYAEANGEGRGGWKVAGVNWVAGGEEVMALEVALERPSCPRLAFRAARQAMDKRGGGGVHGRRWWREEVRGRIE